MAENEGRFLRKPLRVAVLGLGAIGLRVVEALNAGIPGCELAAIAVRDRTKATKQLSRLNEPVPLLSLEEIESHADIVVECAPAHLLSDIVGPFLRAGKTAIVLSASALLSNYHLVDIARDNNGQSSTQPLPISGPWREWLDSLLLENQGKSARERLTLVRLFEEFRGLCATPPFGAMRSAGSGSTARLWRKRTCRSLLHHAKPNISTGVTRLWC
jgi:hypothetical protein